MPIKLKRAYDKPDENDGFRILVDRLWPRGLSKTEAKIDAWLKDIAPSDQLRKWYAHDLAKWLEFKQFYMAELAAKEELIQTLIEKASTKPVTLVYAKRDVEHNNAIVLKEYMDRLMNCRGI